MKHVVKLVGTGALLALAAGISGCSQHANAAMGATNAKYCTPFSTPATGPGAINPVSANPAGAFDDCVHRWGYALASSRDPADVVAQAAVSACSSILSSWSQQAMGTDEGPPSRGRAGAQQAANPVAQQIRMAESRALFYVVQARAGGCAPPPANTLLASNGPAG
jgi:hypothetical protein